MKLFYKPILSLLMIVLFSFASFAQPSNDECVNAIALTLGTTCNPVSGDLTGATQSMPPDNCGGFLSTTANDIWYSFVANGADTTIIEVAANNDLDATFFLLDGCGGNIIACVDYVDYTLTAVGLSAGTYYIRLYDFDDLAADKTYTICVYSPAIANEDCANATLLTQSATCNPISGTIAGATESVAPSNCVNPISITAKDVWYQFVATTTSPIIQAVPTDSLWAIVELYSACDSPGIECGFPPGIGDTTILKASGLTVGNTYFFRVYGHENTFSPDPQLYPDFNVCVYDAPPTPANDDCANAISITAANDKSSCTPTTVNTVGATQQVSPQPSCAPNSSDDDVWYSFTAINVDITIWADNSTFTGGITSVGMAVFDGSCTGTELACVVNTSAVGDSIKVSNLTVGNTYYLDIFSQFTSDQGTFDICVYSGAPPPPAPANNDCAGAIAITAAANQSVCSPTSVNTVGATQSTDPITCSQFNIDDDVWYSFTATDTAMTVQASNFSGITAGIGLTIYDGSCSGTQSDSCRFSAPGDSLKFFNLTIGNTYYLRIFSGTTNEYGTFDICVYGYDFGTGLNELNVLSDISILPNPSSGSFVLNFPKAKYSEMSVEVANIVGQTIATYHFNRNGLASFDLTNHLEGIYFVKIKTAEGTTTKKIILTK